jgi:hypothetical protein
MKIKAKDAMNRWVEATVSDHRYNAFDHYLKTHPHILGFGAGDDFGKPSANDAQEAHAFAVSQLAYEEEGLFARKYAPKKYIDLIGNTISYAAGPGKESVEYEVVDQVGMGKRVSPAGTNLPTADVSSSRKSIAIAHGGVKYGYTTQDLRASAFFKRPLPEGRRLTAMEMYQRHMNFVALQGEAGSNFTGLFNNASVTAANRPSGAVWDAATADTIISDITVGLTNVKIATKDTDFPTKIVMPISSYSRLLIPRSSASDITVLEFIKRIYPGLDIQSADELAILGGSSSKRVVFFNPMNDNMVLHLPMPLMFRAPQEVDLATNVPGEYRYAGLEIRRPATVYYMDAV